MASKYVVTAKSGLAWQVKRSSLAGEVARRKLNMDEESWAVEGVQVMEKFNYKMLISGYSRKERSIIIDEGLARVRNIRERVEMGIRPMYRMATWRTNERAIEKCVKAKKWAGNVQSVLFVQATPGEILRKKVQEVADTVGIRLRVLKQGGRSIKSMLMKSDIKSTQKCWDPICQTEEKGKCNKENSGYSIKCKTCWEDPGKKDEPINKRRYVMHGETSRSARVRCKEHKAALGRKKNSNLWDHCVLEHGSVEAEFEYRVERCFHRDSLMRQIEEADRLECEQGSLLNDKMEFVQPYGLQVKATRMGH